MARGWNRGAGTNAGNAGNRTRPRRARIKVGYTDVEKRADGTYSAKLTAEVGGGRGDEQVRFWVDLDPVGTEHSVDEYGHAQTPVTGLSGATHVVKAALVDGRLEIIDGTEVRRSMDLTKAPKLPDKLHARAVGRGRVFVPVAVNAQDGSPVKGALVCIYEAGELFDHKMVRHTVPLFVGETSERGALEPVQCFDVPLVQGKRRLLIHVAGTKLEDFVTCRAYSNRPPKAPANISRVAASYKQKLLFTRTIRAFARGIKMGSEALREQRKEGSK